MSNSERRASEMNPEHLRETIVQAAIPLITEWDTVTTAQIARAAGIDEATLRRVFDDKDAVLTAALQVHVMTALDPTQVVQDLQSIRLDQPLAARLAEAIDALDTYHGRLVTFLAPLDASGTPQPQPTPRGRHHRRTPHPTVRPCGPPGRRPHGRHRPSRHQTAGARPGTPTAASRNPGRRLPRSVLRPQTNPTPRSVATADRATATVATPG